MIRLLPLMAVAACAGPSPSRAPERPRAPEASPHVESSEPATASPQPEPGPDGPFADACPLFDSVLGRVARSLAERWSSEGRPADASDVDQLLRQEGSPYVWSHTWTLAGQGNLRALAGPRLEAWLASFGDAGERRCGLAVSERSDGRQVVAAVAVDALADLEATPARVRVGSWVEVRARMRVPFSSAKVVVLGPRGAPKSAATSSRGSQVSARFNADAPGAWLVQVLADVEHGPRPVLEALLTAGKGSRHDARQREAPGERTPGFDEAPEQHLLQMLGAARASEGLAALRPEERLAPLAQAQALALRAAGRVAHDLGGGDPAARVAASGLTPQAVGENVAHGATVAAAHRALWSSPSHRSNILSEHFDSIGIGVARDSDGSVWVCELFGRFGDDR